MAIFALILGISAALFSAIPVIGYFGTKIGIVGVLIGIVSLIMNWKHTPKLVMSITALVLSGYGIYAAQMNLIETKNAIVEFGNDLIGEVGDMAKRVTNEIGDEIEKQIDRVGDSAVNAVDKSTDKAIDNAVKSVKAIFD